MRKFHFIFFLVVLQGINSYGQFIKFKTSDFGLKSKVKSSYVRSYQATDKFGEISRGNLTHIALTFVQDHILWDERESNTDKFFDANGNLLTRIKLSPGLETNWNKSAKYTYSYNLNGNLTQHEEIENNKLISKTLFFYNQRNQIIEKKTYNSEGNLNSRIIYEYNNRNQLVQIDEYNDKEHTEQTQYEFNIYGQIVAVACFKPDEDPFIEKNKYDISGNLIEKLTAYETIKYKYNKYGDLIEEKSFWKNGSSDVSSYEYEYDAVTNWIKRIDYYNGVVQQIHERKIAYY